MAESTTIMYKCTECELLFSTMEDINHHQCEPQPQLELFKCSGCQAIYADLDMFNSHICKPPTEEQFEVETKREEEDYTQVVVTSQSSSEELIQHFEQQQQVHDSMVQANTTMKQEEILMPAQHEKDVKVEESNHRDSPEFVYETVTEEQINAQQQQIQQIEGFMQVEPAPFKIASVRGNTESGAMEGKAEDEARQCPSCGKLFQNAKMFRRHRRTHMMGSLHSCYYCRRFFTSKQRLSLHSRLLHSKCPEDHSVPSDNFTISDLDEFANSYQCSSQVEELVMLHRSVLRRFYCEEELASPKISCLSCMTICNGKKALKKHLTQIHREKLYSCSFCDLLFLTKSKRQRHEKLLHGFVKRYKCGTCKANFSTVSKLKYHKLTRHKRFRCDEVGCRMRFRTRLGLEFHIREHLGLRLDYVDRVKYACRMDNCGRVFGRKEALKRHRINHGRARKCPWCYFAFTDTRLFHRHCKLRHLQWDKVCHECGVVFGSPVVLARHRRLFHRLEYSQTNLDNPQSLTEGLPTDVPFYHCEICFDVFLSHEGIMQHMVDAKETHRQMCPCLVQFDTSELYLKHLSVAHQAKRKGPGRPPVDPKRLQFTCQFCQAKFVRKQSLNKHVQKQHLTHPNYVSEFLESRKSTMEDGSGEEKPIVTQMKPPDAPRLCVVTVVQEGPAVPVTGKDPYTRILNVTTPPIMNEQLRTNQKKRLHHNIFQLRNLIQNGLKVVAPRGKVVQERLYSSLFEDILHLEDVQKALADLEDYAEGCSVTFSVPFPDNLVSNVWVNFLMSFDSQQM